MMTSVSVARVRWESCFSSRSPGSPAELASCPLYADATHFNFHPGKRLAWNGVNAANAALVVEFRHRDRPRRCWWEKGIIAGGGARVPTSEGSEANRAKS